MSDEERKKSKKVLTKKQKVMYSDLVVNVPKELKNRNKTNDVYDCLEYLGSVSTTHTLRKVFFFIFLQECKCFAGLIREML